MEAIIITPGIETHAGTGQTEVKFMLHSFQWNQTRSSWSPAETTSLLSSSPCLSFSHSSSSPEITCSINHCTRIPGPGSACRKHHLREITNGSFGRQSSQPQMPLRRKHFFQTLVADEITILLLINYA